MLTNLNDATFNQTLASDQWAFYQAKSIKLNSYEIAHHQLAKSANAADPEVAKLVEEYKAKVATYKKEQKEIEAKAHEFEEKREAARAVANIASGKGGKMGLSISFFSVAVALASICTVTKKKPLWFVALFFAAVAISEMVMAWTA